MLNPRLSFRQIVFFAALFSACVLLSGIGNAAPSVTLSRKSGPPTSRILVSGRGFAPNVGVDIYFGKKDEALIVTNGKGEFENAKIHAPRTALPGKHWVTALERNNDKGAQEPFRVQTDWRQFHFSADHAGMNPYENVLDPKTVGNVVLRWTYNVGIVPASAPAVAEGVAYAGSTKMYAIDAKTGVDIWSYDGLNASQPAVENGVVYSVGEDLTALKASTGEALWSYAVDSDYDPTVSGGIVYVGSNDFNVYALNARTGVKLWSFPTGSYVQSSPAVADGIVYIGSLDHNVYALNALTGEKLWSYATNGRVWSSPTVVNGAVYVGSEDHNLYALNALTGAKLWSYATDSVVYSSPAVSDEVVYVTSTFEVFALDANTGAKLWSYRDLSSPFSPVLANGVVYVGFYDHLTALSASTGIVLWNYELLGPLADEPAVVDGVIYVGSGDGNIYAFGLPRGDGIAEDADSKRPDLKMLRPETP